MVFIVVYVTKPNDYPNVYAQRAYGPFEDSGAAHRWRMEHLKEGAAVSWDVVTYLGLDPIDADRR